MQIGAAVRTIFVTLVFLLSSIAALPVAQAQRAAIDLEPKAENCSRSRQNLQAVLLEAQTLETDRRQAIATQQRCDQLTAAATKSPSYQLNTQTIAACREARTWSVRVNDIEWKLPRLQAEVRGCEVLEAAQEERERPARERAAQQAEAKATQELSNQRTAAEARELNSQREYHLLLVRSSPQALFLLGGRFEREGNNSRATETYNYLIDKHTETTWAVKANDRLLQMHATSESERNRERSSRQAACIAGVPLCQDRCSPELGYATYQQCKDACISRCQ